MSHACTHAHHHRFNDSHYISFVLWAFYSHFYCGLLSLLRCLFLTMRQPIVREKKRNWRRSRGRIKTNKMVHLFGRFSSLRVWTWVQCAHFGKCYMSFWGKRDRNQCRLMLKTKHLLYEIHKKWACKIMLYVHCTLCAIKPSTCTLYKCMVISVQPDGTSGSYFTTLHPREDGNEDAAHRDITYCKDINKQFSWEKFIIF